MTVGRIIHADWSKNPARRWAAYGSFEGGGFHVSHVARFSSSPEDLLALAAERGLLIGFDFPIGVPEFYGRAVGVERFPDLLERLLTGDFATFDRSARDPRDISIHRPFYPAVGGGAKQADLIAAHGLTNQDDLRRLCERRPFSAPAASPLFWTVGAAQVGLAAAAGWREYIKPLDASGRARLWPFDGALDELMSASGLTIAETYPSQAMRFLDIHPGSGFSKADQERRKSVADRVFASADRLGAVLSTEVADDVADGFAAARGGDDAFDALIGLLGMLAVVRGERKEGTPTTPGVRRIEGWILGLDGSSAGEGNPAS